MASELSEKEESTVPSSDNCLQSFRQLDLNDHHDELYRELEKIAENYGEKLAKQVNHPETQIWLDEVNHWEQNAIQIVQQRAQECREKIFRQAHKFFQQIKVKFDKLNDQIKVLRQEHRFNENNLDELKEKFTQLENDLVQIPNISIQRDSSSFIRKISVVIPSDNFSYLSSAIDLNTRWKQNAVTVAGGNGQGRQLTQFSCPCGIAVDDEEQCIYVTDCLNRGVVQWKYGEKIGQLVVGGPSASVSVISQPTDVIVDKLTDSLIICDWGHKRVIQWPRRSTTTARSLISDINCWGVANDSNGDLYISDSKKHEVRRWDIAQGISSCVAGGNEQGDQLNQLSNPTHLFVDKDFSVYVSDNYNHRVMKWAKDAKEGIVVAGGNGSGDSLTQLNYPQGVIVDHMGNVYVADSGNNRIVRWLQGSTEGQIIAGGNGKGQGPNQLSDIDGLSFDRYGNIYAVDWSNYRVQKFEIASTRF